MTTNRTHVVKKEEITRQWYVIDAKDKILGRVASKAAVLLRGKHKVIYTPSLDTGDGVVIINASQIKVTGRKMKQKVYRRFSGYPGGLREVVLGDMLEKSPTTVMKLAVQRMLPQGPLGRDMIKKLKVYAAGSHEQSAQKPVVMEV